MKRKGGGRLVSGPTRKIQGCVGNVKKLNRLRNRNPEGGVPRGELNTVTARKMSREISDHRTVIKRGTAPRCKKKEKARTGTTWENTMGKRKSKRGTTIPRGKKGKAAAVGC